MTEKNKVKILFIQKTGKPYKTIIEHLNIPSTDYDILNLTPNQSKKKLEKDQNTVTLVLGQLKPEVIIPVGAYSLKTLGFVERTLKQDAGRMFEVKEDFGNYVICPLYDPGRFKHIKYSNEYTQLDNLKKYMMRYYKYGLINDD